MFEPQFEEFAENNKDKASFLKLDVEELEDIAMELEVEGLPTIIFFNNKKKVADIKGSKMDKLEGFMKEHVSTL